MHSKKQKPPPTHSVIIRDHSSSKAMSSSHFGMDPSLYPNLSEPQQQPPYPNIPPPPINNVNPFSISSASNAPPPPPPQQYVQTPPPFHSVNISNHASRQQEPQGINAENPIPIHYQSMEEPKAPSLKSSQEFPSHAHEGASHPQHPTHPQQQQTLHSSQQPIQPQEQGYHAIYVHDLRVTPNDYVESSESAEASTSFSLALCLALLFGCVGCFPLTCIPFWFTYATYRDSASPQARSLAALSKSLFWVLVLLNTCLFCVTLFVVVIVPPVVVVPRYYHMY
ncbi:hypothetical protein C9374_008095 [Naegleria lovaniensis]|uniref:Uncharacterized protein n=1 Tax=Naegleria lovaniensis TaxID=51637 RepID=A0AA88GL13_NAELO|nr:uncharacterized protein C9374_008095 [Naegleria lovaniensis]KAG2378456.1 hypothetical protein C9374_008095 [Naegleria lovaniensis]